MALYFARFFCSGVIMEVYVGFWFLYVSLFWFLYFSLCGILISLCASWASYALLCVEAECQLQKLIWKKLSTCWCRFSYSVLWLQYVSKCVPSEMNATGIIFYCIAASRQKPASCSDSSCCSIFFRTADPGQLIQRVYRGTYNQSHSQIIVNGSVWF